MVLEPDRKEFNLSKKILKLRRYLPNPDTAGSMIYFEGDYKSNRGIYVDLGAVMGNIKEFINLLHLNLCAILEGEILLKKKDIKRVYAIIDKLAGDKLI